MRRILIFGFLVILMALPVCAMEFEAPPPPQSAAQYLPGEADSFGEGLWNVLRTAVQTLNPSLSEASRCCLRLFCVSMLVGLIRQAAPGVTAWTVELAGTAAAAVLLLEPSASLIELGVRTTAQLREYGKLLLPVMAGAMAARGGVTTATALYAGTAVFDAALSAVVSNVMVPMLWMYLGLSIGQAALAEPMLKKMRELLRWAMEWALKLSLYVFTGYLTVTGVISGTADAAASKAARIAISGAVPVVGGILSDAADAVLLSAGTLGSGAGMWGILTVLAIFCAPVLRIGAQYLMLKVTAAMGAALGGGACGELAGDFAQALGLLVALISTQLLLLLISTVCFLKGVGT